MKGLNNLNILFVTGFGPIAQKQELTQKLYLDTFNIPFKEEEGGYLHTDTLEGVNFFGLWPLQLAAESCFGKKDWPEEIKIPQAWIEFDVEDVKKASEVLKSQGYKLLVENKKEPWGQVVTRFISPEGLLIGLTYTPWMRKNN